MVTVAAGDVPPFKPLINIEESMETRRARRVRSRNTAPGAVRLHSVQPAVHTMVRDWYAMGGQDW